MIPKKNQKEATVLKWVEHKNPKVRKWALGALTRVHGVEVIPILKSLEAGETITAEMKAFINGIGTLLSWDISSDRERQRIPLMSLIGVEVLTEEKTEGQHTLFSQPQVTDPGTVKVLRLFAGSDFKEGEVLPVTSSRGKPGMKFLVSPRNGKIRLPSPVSEKPWNFPPEGQWDGELTLVGGTHRPVIHLKPLEPWLKRLSRQPTPYADEFLDEALRSAPFSVALWALQSHREYVRPETLSMLKEKSGLPAPGKNDTSSLRNMFLYDMAMRIIYRKLWEWDSDRITLIENILAHPLADKKEAWLLFKANALEYHPSSATSTDWMRLAKAARNNQSWKEVEMDPLHRRMFEHIVWHYTWTESRSKFDASTSIDYLMGRWAIPDRGKPSESAFTNTRGSMLSRSLPLTPGEVERLRTALAQRLRSSGEPVTSEEILGRVRQIQSLTWDEITNQPFP